MEYNTNAFSGFGAIQDDIIGILAIGYGGDRKKAAAKVNELIALLQRKVEEGALKATPRIKAEVRETVAPYVYVSIGLGVLGLLIGVGTFLYVRKKHA